MSLLDRVINDLQSRREKVLKGEINSIPSPFIRSSDSFIGIEQGKEYLVSANTKVGKTAFTSFLFLYTPLLYAYNHPEQIRLKVFYYPLEESPEDILERFICFILNRLSNNKYHISRTELKSSKNEALPEEILSILRSEEYAKILKFFEDTVIFSSSSNPSGVWKEMIRYAEDNGKVYKKKVKVKDEFGVNKEIEIFDHYETNDPNEYRIIIIDHISLVSTERGFSLKESIDKLGEYAILLRNLYKFTPVIIQQQSAESESLQAKQMGLNGASIQTLADSKYTARNCDVAIAVNSPLLQKKADWNGYNIRKLKDFFRYAEILINRQGSPGDLIPLFYDGKVCDWKEMPLPNELEDLENVYKYIEKCKSSIDTPVTSNISLLAYSKNKINNLANNSLITKICNLFR